MAWLQRRLPADLAADMERQSRAWKLICPKCDHVTSYWEIGGVRWQAAGNPRKLLKCAGCHRWTWHRTEYRPSTDAPPTSPPIT